MYGLSGFDAPVPREDDDESLASGEMIPEDQRIQSFCSIWGGGKELSFMPDLERRAGEEAQFFYCSECTGEIENKISDSTDATHEAAHEPNAYFFPNHSKEPS